MNNKQKTINDLAKTQFAGPLFIVDCLLFAGATEGAA